MEEQKMQYLFGIHPVMEAIKAGKKFDKVLVKQGMEGPQFGELMALMKQNGIQFQFVPAERLNKAVRGAHQGVIAYISKIDYVPCEELVDTALATNPAPMIVILDGVSDVRNLGAIARTLECAGGSGNGTENTLQAFDILNHFMKMDMIGRIPVTRFNCEEQKQEIKKCVEKFIG